MVIPQAQKKEAIKKMGISIRQISRRTALSYHDIKSIQCNLSHTDAAFTPDKFGNVSGRMKEDSAAHMEKYMQAINKPVETAN